MEDEEDITLLTPLDPKPSKLPWTLTTGLKRFIRVLTTANLIRRISINFEKFISTIFKFLTLVGVYKTFSWLISLVAQRFLDGSNLIIKSIHISKCGEDSVTLHVNLVIQGTGPVPVTVIFTKPVKLGFIDKTFKSRVHPSFGSSSPLNPQKTSTDLEISKINHLNGELVYFGQAEMPNLKLYPSVPNYIGLELKVNLDNPEEFAKFASQLITSEVTVLQLSGLVSILLFEFLPIYNLKFDKTCSIKGMKGLNQLQINRVVVSDGEDEYLLLNIDCSLLNPADIDVDLGDVNLNMFYKGFLVGTVTIPDFKLETGKNQLAALGFIQPDPSSESATKACYELLDRYVAGKEFKVNIRGSHPRCHVIPYWSAALSVLNILTCIQGNQENIIVKASLVLSPVQLISKVMGSNAPTILSLFNPFDAPIAIYEIQATATMRGTRMGKLIDKRYTNPIILNPHQVTLTPQVDLNLEIGRASLASLFSSVANQELYFDCKAKITVRVGKYPATLTYRQQRVSLVLGA